MANDFRLEEYRSVREEALRKIASAETLEFYAAGAIAAVYAWLGSNKVPADAWLWKVPVVFPLLGVLRAWTLDRQLRVIGAYLAGIEAALGADHIAVGQRPEQKVAGWEEYRRRNIAHYNDFAGRVFWLLLLGATLVIPVWYERASESKKPAATSGTAVDSSRDSATPPAGTGWHPGIRSLLLPSTDLLPRGTRTDRAGPTAVMRFPLTTTG